MAAFLDDFLLLVVLAVPGFLVVSVGRYLSGVGEDTTQLETGRLILVWSVIVNALVIASASELVSPEIVGLESLGASLLSFRTDLLSLWFAVSILVGLLYAVGIVLRLPHRARERLQSRSIVVRLPEQPWRDFLEMHDYVAVHTKNPDDSPAVFTGWVYSYSSSKTDPQLVLDRPYKWLDKWTPVVADESRIDADTGEFIPEASSQLWISASQIDRIVALPEPTPVVEESTVPATDTATAPDEDSFWFPRGAISD